jgi:hypothetical protein
MDQTVTFFDPQGNLKDVPASKYDEAVRQGGKRAVSFISPDGRKKWVREDQVNDAVKFGGKIDPDFLSANSRGEGLYLMQGPGAQKIPVPYSNVPLALASGTWGWTNIGGGTPDTQVSSGDRYAKDKAAEGKSPSFVGNWNEAMQGILAPTEGKAGETPLPILPGMNVNSAKAAGRVIYSTPSFLAKLAKAFTEVPKESPYSQDSFLNMVDPFKIPEDLQKQFVQDYEQNGAQRAFDNLYGTLVGMGVVSKVGDVAGEAADRIPGVRTLKNPQQAGEAIREFVSHKSTKPLVRKILDENKVADAKAAGANKANAETHRNQTLDALHKNREVEDLHAMKQRHADEQTELKHKQETEEIERHNQRVHAKALQGHEQNTAEVNSRNEKVQAKYKSELGEANEHNSLIDQQVDQRQADEAKLEADTVDYYKMEDEKKAEAKADADTAWQPWHEAVKGATVPSGEITTPLKKIAEVSPEVRRELRLLVPEASEVPPESEYAVRRAEVMRAAGFKNPDSYNSLNSEGKERIDNVMRQMGIEPEPIDLLPDDEQEMEIPIEKIHRARSIIGRNIASGKYEGPLLGEMKQVYKALDHALIKESQNRGAYSYLLNGRRATSTYLEAFGRNRNVPKMVGEMRKKLANPDFYKEEVEEDRLTEPARKYDPELEKKYSQVRALYEKLKNEPNVEKLTAKKKVVPEAPSIEDARPGYRLKEEPVYEPPTIDDLREGYRLKPLPERPTPKQLTPPSRAELPDRPEQVQPEREEDLVGRVQRAKEDAVERGENWFRYRSAWIATSAVIGSALIYRLTRFGISGAFEEALAGMTAFAVTNKIADVLENPNVVKWLTAPNEKDPKIIEKLPPDQRKQLLDAWGPQLVKLQKADVKVSPVIMRALMGTAAGRAVTTPEELRKRAEELKPPAAPEPQSQALPYTHVFDPIAGTIVAA